MTTRRSFFASIAAAIVGAPLYRKLFPPPVVDPSLTFSMDEFARLYCEPHLAAIANSIDLMLVNNFTKRMTEVDENLSAAFNMYDSELDRHALLVFQPARARMILELYSDPSLPEEIAA